MMAHLLLVVGKRVKLNLLTGKVVLAALLFILAALATAWLGIRQYDSRQGLFDETKDRYLLRLQQVMVYSATEVDVNRPPEKLGVLARGVGEHYGSVANLKGKYGPITIASREKSSFLLAALPQFDFATLTALLLSLLGVFFAYTTVAGEREEGTLALTLSHSLPRSQLILAEYVASVISVFAPFGLGVGTFLLVLNSRAPSILSGESLARLGAFVVVSLMLISSFVGLGMVASVLSRQSIAALVVAFLSWVGLVVVYPSLSAWVARVVAPLKLEAVSLSDLTTFELAQQADEPAFTPSELDEGFANQNFAQAGAALTIESVSPYASFMTLAQILAGTDVGSVNRFYHQARQANNELRAWQERKLQQYPNRERFYMGNWGPLDTSGIPQPIFREERLNESLTRAVAPALSLCVWAMLTLAVSVAAFLRYDVRN